MSVDKINPFTQGNISQVAYKPVSPIQQVLRKPNQHQSEMNEISEIASEKASLASVGLGGCNKPTETLGNRLMFSA